MGLGQLLSNLVTIDTTVLIAWALDCVSVAQGAWEDIPCGWLAIGCVHQQGSPQEKRYLRG